ncbi:MAG: energy transducer TonB [Ignavibacteriae bacterium]|nr:energy transducer TonB [Ignavibacteriota bacterium]
MLYVNEMGKITNVVSIESLSKEVDKYIVDQMKNWKMEIYKINDKPIKYIINWSFELFKPKGENHLSLLNSSLKVSENIKTLPQEEFFVAVEEMPSPIGGMQAIQQKIIYPELARKAGIEGRVYVKAFIDENGNVASAEIIRGLDGGLSEAAMEAVKATKFEPGRQRGVPVKVQVSIPILFKLSNEEIKK